ncbi:UNVERIFIED_CONTAM: hypothetical protein GTU68_014188 [Idotea baltica]|nr:hypothetical protein [Idotea baltica]
MARYTGPTIDIEEGKSARRAYFWV